MEYKVEFEDGPHANYFVYAIEKNEGKMYCCDVRLECRIDGENIRTIIKKNDIEGYLPNHEWESKVYEGLRKKGTNCIKVKNKNEINGAVKKHKEAYQERFDWECGRLQYHLKNLVQG